MTMIVMTTVSFCRVDRDIFLTAINSFKQASEDGELLYKMFLILLFMVFQIFAYSMLGTEIMSAVKM